MLYFENFDCDIPLLAKLLQAIYFILQKQYNSGRIKCTIRTQKCTKNCVTLAISRSTFSCNFINPSCRCFLREVSHRGANGVLQRPNGRVLQKTELMSGWLNERTYNRSKYTNVVYTDPSSWKVVSFLGLCNDTTTYTVPVILYIIFTFEFPNATFISLYICLSPSKVIPKQTHL